MFIVVSRMNRCLFCDQQDLGNNNLVLLQYCLSELFYIFEKLYKLASQISHKK